MNIPNWSDVVKHSKDTVVQVFAGIAKFNWFEPFKTPQRLQHAGSGFFVSDQGYLVTNFHVVDEAVSIKIQIPTFGQEQFSAEVCGVYPDMDIALLRLTDEDFEKVRSKLGSIPVLQLGNSDEVYRTQGVLALGYPLAGQGLKSTQGIVSGFEKIGFTSYIQTTAPLNPGNSGGPSLNIKGEVIGVNFAGVLAAQNVGFIIPTNDITPALKDLLNVKLLRKPYLGGIFAYVNEDLVGFLGNPEGGGFYVAEVFKNSSLEKAGVQPGDMIYEINGHHLDMFGEISVPWAEDRISVFDLLNRYKVGSSIEMVLYRRGKRLDIQFTLERGVVLPIRVIYPKYEKVDFEVFGGMVMMQLTLNHVNALVEHNPLFYKYAKIENQDKPKLVITSVLPGSQAHRCRSIEVGNVIKEVNGEPVSTLDEFRAAILKGNDNKFLTLRFENKVFAVLSMQKIEAQEEELSKVHMYKVSDLFKKTSK
ncbi:trypsin-like peptidase domain-containing protein [Candidatus Babeliales bacterium]|nr:trypsin-like peptidase domain-containing protein [Candidatus Babeliales bacterium]